MNSIHMSFLTSLARFIFWLLVLSWSVALLRRIIAWVLRGAETQTGTAPGESEAAPGQRLHRDPVCGMHVSEEISFSLREAGATLHFCSPECRDRYATGKRVAANG